MSPSLGFPGDHPGPFKRKDNWFRKLSFDPMFESM